MLLYLLTLTLGALIGGAMFMLLPVVKDTTEIGHKYVWLAMFSVKRGAFLLQDDGELNFKKFKYDSVGSEKVSIGGDTVTLTDPSRALQSFKGKTFALADESHGVIYRLSDAAAGARKHALEKQGNMVGTTDTKEHRIQAWIRKYVTIPTDTPIDLRDVRYLATGTESGTDSWLVRTWYKFSRIRENSGASVLKLLIPVAAFAATLIIIWQAKSQGGGSATPAETEGNRSTLNVLWLTLAPLTRTHKIIVGCVCMAIGLALAYTFIGFAVIGFPLAFGIGIALGFGATAAFVLFISLIGMGAWLSTFFLDMGLQTFDNPLFVETDRGFVLEDRYVGKPGHKLGKHRITFVLDSTGAKSRVDYAGMSQQVVRAEGTNGPKQKPDEGGEAFGHLVPYIDPDERKHYISTFGAVSSLRDGFIGKDTDERHKEAKEEFGDGINDVGAKFIIGASFAGIILASVIGLFFL